MSNCITFNFQRLLTFFILVVSYFSRIYAQSPLDESQIAERILQRKNENAYREGTRWTNDNVYVNTVEYNGYPAGCFTGRGCYGLMIDMMEYASNYEYPIRHVPGTYNNLPQIHIGDGVRVKNDTHSVVVIGRNDNNHVITVVEGNYNSSIHWGREIDLSNPSNGFTYIATFWPEVYDNVEDIEGMRYRSVNIYNFSGLLVKSIPRTDLPTEYFLQELPHGTYVVKVGKKTYKILK